ncbi:hypothetical protein FOMG_19613 [Fusarium oxysporum f. sp. melonis 26406]|uniref:Uncharacterized protein n=1 Tax=Fusarium oxysporum f. sp. melonis 26406 TaxID=1089452 RepID=W9ZR88_FUSOX|nr:hypothetical protein FOMG_19613 [Fusarium oxysporum f. sp. melonis 26406]
MPQANTLFSLALPQAQRARTNSQFIAYQSRQTRFHHQGATATIVPATTTTSALSRTKTAVADSPTSNSVQHLASPRDLAEKRLLPCRLVNAITRSRSSTAHA